MEKPAKIPKPHPRELLFPLVFLAVLLLVPIGIVDFYPISSAPMFNEEPQVYCDYLVCDAAGKELPLEWFHLQRNDNGNPPGFGHGIVPRWSVDRLGKIPSQEEILDAVRAGMKERQIAGPLVVEWLAIGDLDGNRVGVVQAHKMTVATP